MTRLTREQAKIVGAYTGILAGPFDDLHEYIEQLMGRPVWTHELASKELAAEIKEAARSDFEALCAEGDMP